MSLFGQLFGGGGGSTPPTIDNSDCQPTTKEFVEVAIDLINSFVERNNAIWVSIPNDLVADTDEPWEVTRAVEFEFGIKIVFFTSDLQDRELLKYLKATEVPDGMTYGIMYQQGFEPKLKDILKWQNKNMVVKSVNPIQPIDCPIVYIVEFGV